VTIFLMMIGFGRDSEVETLPSFPEFFLIFSFFTVSIGTYNFSNLAPRSRYLWFGVVATGYGTGSTLKAPCFQI